MPENIHELSRIIGGLQNAVQNLTSQWAMQDHRANDSRTQLHGEVGELKDRVMQMAAEVENLAVDVRDMQPAVRDWISTKAQGMGAAAATSKIGHILWMAAGGVLAFLGWLFDHFVSGRGTGH